MLERLIKKNWYGLVQLFVEHGADFNKVRPDYWHEMLSSLVSFGDKKL
jgi:hypothetical protein